VPLNRPASLPLPLLALSLQFAAFAAVALVVFIFSLKLPIMLFAGCCGLAAAGLSFFCKLPIWWLSIQGLFIPGLAATLTLDIPPAYFLGAFIVFGLVYWNTFQTRVPLYLSSGKVWLALEGFLPPKGNGKAFKFIDIGSGLGGVLTHLAHARPDGVYCGVESAPLPFMWSWLRIRLGGHRKCRVHWGNFWHCDLAGYDVVFAYLSPAPMEQLWRKAKAEMRPGTIFISSTFNVPGQTPAQTIEVEDLHHSTLLVWQM
jgi:hypothetical protein